MSVKEEKRDLGEKQQRKLSPKDQIFKRYGIHKREDMEKRKARSINELYKQRYRNKFR